MNVKPLTISAVALFGVLGLYMATANPEKAGEPTTNEGKISQALKMAELKSPEKAVKKKILVFSKTNGFRHASIETGKIALTQMGESTGAFEAVVSDDMKNFDKENIEKFDAICFLSTTQNVFAPNKDEHSKMTEEEKKMAPDLEKARKANFMNFIASGKGFIGIHAATDTCYEWPEYGMMIGGYFDGHPWGANMEVSIKADEKNKSHALLNGVIPEAGELRFNEEIYQHKDPYDSEKMTRLLRLDADASQKPGGGIKRKDNDFGVSWVKPHEKGRVYYCSLGHNDHIYWNKHVLRHYYAGILYALGE